MFQPDFVGRQILYLNPTGTGTKISTANLAAIDTTAGAMDVISPYAYTATVRDDYDAQNFILADAGADIVSGKRIAFGLFLSPDLEKKSLLWRVSGKALFSNLVGANPHINFSFFFGRKATDNTVVSSLAGVNNQLAKYMLLPSQSNRYLVSPASGSGAGFTMSDEIESQVFTLDPGATDYVYCFGFFMDNYGAADITLNGAVSLSVQKYRSELGVFMPRG